MHPMAMDLERSRGPRVAVGYEAATGGIIGLLNVRHHLLSLRRRRHYRGRDNMRVLFPVSCAKLRYLICAVAIVGAAAFVSSASAQSPNSNEKSEHQAGAHIYMHARCFACHGQYGFGGVGPRFREDRFLGVTGYVVGQILIGRGVMPSFADALSDEQIAAVATYIRTNWGNNFGPVKSSEVAKVRKQIQVHAPQGPHVSSNNQPQGVPVPPRTPMPPGNALPPPPTK